MKPSPTDKQLKPFLRLVDALKRVGFKVESTIDGMDGWVNCKMPENIRMPAQDGKVLGRHALHFLFDCATGRVANYSVTRDVWELTDEQNVVHVEATRPIADNTGNA